VDDSIMLVDKYDEEELNKYYIDYFKRKEANKMKDRVYIIIPYRHVAFMKHVFDLYWCVKARMWMCLEKDFNDIVYLINERGG
jgi:hypothetical protein